MRGEGSLLSPQKEKVSYILDKFGIPRKTEHIRAVAQLEELKRKNQANPWPVIEKCLEIWAATTPGAWDSYLIRLDDIRETRQDKKFGESKTGMYRYTLDIPQKVMFMIRCLYSDEELPMNKQFFREFARRFPKMKVAEKN